MVRSLLLIVVFFTLMFLNGCQKDKETIREMQDSLSKNDDDSITIKPTEFLQSDWVIKTNTYKTYLLQRLPSLLLIQSPFYSIADVTFQVNVYKDVEDIVLVEEKTEFEDGSQGLKRFFLQNRQIVSIEYVHKSWYSGKENWEKTITYFPSTTMPRIFQKKSKSFQGLQSTEEGWKEITLSHEENYYSTEEKDMQEMIAAANGTGNYLLLFQDIEDYGNGELYLRATTKEEHDVVFFIPKPDSTILKIQENRNNFVGRFIKVVFTIQPINDDRRAVYHHLKFLN